MKQGSVLEEEEPRDRLAICHCYGLVVVGAAGADCPAGAEGAAVEGAAVEGAGVSGIPAAAPVPAAPPAGAVAAGAGAAGCVKA